MPTIQEEISRVKELIFGNKTKDNQINECDSCMDDHHKEHGDSYMAKRQLYTIATKAQSMHDRLEHGEKLEDWMESKIAQMADNIDSVVNSFNYDESKEEMVCEVCGEVHEGTCGGENTEEEIYICMPCVRDVYNEYVKFNGDGILKEQENPIEE